MMSITQCGVGCVEHMPPYSAHRMNESMKEYFRYFWKFVAGTETVYCVFLCVITAIVVHCLDACLVPFREVM